MEIICNLKNLNLTFGQKTIFQGADFSIQRGEKIGLLGLNGKGKSCLLNILSGKLAPDETDPPCEFVKSTSLFNVLHIPQELPLPENDILLKDYFFFFYPNLKELKEKLDKITHEMEGATDNLDRLVLQQKELFDKLDHLGAWELQEKFNNYLKHFGLTKFENSIHQFSGGEKRKILLALGLSSEAELILWDEPTNHLDLESIQSLEQELNNSSKAFILISHDRYLLSKVTNKILQIRNTKIETFNGGYTKYLEYLEQEEEARVRLLGRLKNRLRREQDWMNQGIKARGTRSKKRVESFLDLKSRVSTIKEQAKRDLNLSIGESGRKTKVLMSLNNGSFFYDESKQILNKLNLTIGRKDKIGILGPNGAGKTTLIKLITKELNLKSGTLKQADDLNIGYFKQTREELGPEETPYTFLGEGTDSVTLPDGRKQHVAGYIKKFLFTGEDLYRPLKTFSGGERNRLQLAANLLRPSELWIFDEPTNDLDLETIQVLERELINYQGAIIIVSHDRAFLSAVSNKMWVLDRGSIEQFNGGFEQAEQYLEILQIERDLEEEANQTPKKSVEVSTEQIKLSNKEKSRLKEIPTLIEEHERKIEVLEKKIQTFDFSSMDGSDHQLYGQISAKKEELEENLLGLYEEQEELENR